MAAFPCVERKKRGEGEVSIWPLVNQTKNEKSVSANHVGFDSASRATPWEDVRLYSRRTVRGTVLIENWQKIILVRKYSTRQTLGTVKKVLFAVFSRRVLVSTELAYIWTECIRRSFDVMSTNNIPRSFRSCSCRRRYLDLTSVIMKSNHFERNQRRWCNSAVDCKRSDRLSKCSWQKVSPHGFETQEFAVRQIPCVRLVIKNDDFVLTKNPHPILQRTGSDGVLAVVCDWSLMVPGESVKRRFLAR